ncbi:MAG: proteasome subunit beta [Hadesarchaea archaeon]|jgi:proteasome beta subunit|nr:MAG: proteasome subunit beta [Hadesarchaea archaeon]
MEYFAGTIVGLKTAGGAVLASDTRAVGYYLVLSKRARKLFRLEERIGAAFSGSPGDIQSLVSLLQAEANLYRLEHGRSISPRGLAQVASNILQGRRWYPYLLEGILCGFEDGEVVLLTLDPAGGRVEEEDFSSGGTGAQVAYGVLERNYRRGLSLEEGKRLAVEAIRTAIERDVATGDKVVVSVVDAGGYRELTDEEVDGLLAPRT